MSKQYRRWIPTRVRKTVLERDGNTCQVCSSTTDLCISHIIPPSENGSNTADNLQVLCRTCVAIKGNYVLTIEDMRKYLVLYEAQWLEDDKHKIGRVKSLIRYDLWEQERSRQNIDWTNDQDMKRTKDDVLHSLWERHKLFLERKGCA